MCVYLKTSHLHNLLRCRLEVCASVMFCLSTDMEFQSLVSYLYTHFLFFLFFINRFTFIPSKQKSKSQLPSPLSFPLPFPFLPKYENSILIPLKEKWNIKKLRDIMNRKERKKIKNHQCV